MSLTYTLPKGMTNADVKDPYALENLCFNLWFTGVGSLKDEAAFKEFWARYNFMCRLNHDTPPFLKYEFVKSMIGLTTNGDRMTRLQFIKKWSTVYFEKIETLEAALLALRAKSPAIETLERIRSNGN